MPFAHRMGEGGRRSDEGRNLAGCHPTATAEHRHRICKSIDIKAKMSSESKAAFLAADDADESIATR